MRLIDGLDAWDGALPVALAVVARSVESRRASLRGLAARALGRPLHDVAIEHARDRAPHVTRPTASGLHVSSSSRDGLAVLAAAREAIGVDVERVDEEAVIPWRILHPDDAGLLTRLRPPARARAFARLWTCKEAHLKALGTGLSLGPEMVRVAFVDDEVARASREGSSAVTTELRTFWRSQAGASYAISVAVERRLCAAARSTSATTG